MTRTIRRIGASVPVTEGAGVRYRDVAGATIPHVPLPGGGTVAVIAGEAAGIRGPVRDLVVDATYLDVALPPGANRSAPRQSLQ